MDDRFIENENELLDWIDDASCDYCETPREYPCLAKTYVSSWMEEETTAEFLYKDDIDKLMNKFNQHTNSNDNDN